MRHKLMLRAVDVNSTSDLSFLYGVLSRRLGEKDTNISHKKLPKYEEHCIFVQARPYLAHYVITDRKLLIGVVYVTRECEIGIWIAPEYRREKIGSWVLETIMRLHREKIKEWKANINPLNETSKAFFSRYGFMLTGTTPEQLTYTRLADATDA